MTEHTIDSPRTYLVSLARRGFKFFNSGREITWQRAYDAKRCMTFCPVHELSGEHDPSAIVTIKDGTPLIYCHVCQRPIFDESLTATCTATYRAAARTKKLCAGPAQVVASYRYPGGQVKQRLRLADGTKSFAWMTPDGPGGKLQKDLRGDPGLYGADRLGSGTPLTERGVLHAAGVFAVEGEKDTDTLRALGLPAVSFPAMRPSAVEALRGHVPVVIPDDDLPGIRKATEFAYLALMVCPAVITLPPLGWWPVRHGKPRIRGYDVSDLAADFPADMPLAEFLIGMAEVAQERPDGQFAMVATNPSHLPAPVLRKDTEYWSAA